MPIVLANILSNTATVGVEFMGESASLTIYPARVSEKTLAVLMDFEGAAANPRQVKGLFDGMNRELVDIIKEWDLFEDVERTRPFPLDADRLPEIPMLLRVAMLKEIIAAFRPE